MRLKSNTTDLPDYAVRRAITWVCTLLEFPAKNIGLVYVRHVRVRWHGKSTGWSGRATGSMSLRCRVGRDGDTAEQYRWLVECLGHEVKHLRDFARNRPYSMMEATARQCGYYVLAKFRKQEASLISEWEKPPAVKAAKPKRSVAEANEQKARAGLERWTAELQARERKVKAARKKVRQYAAKVARYERVAAKRAERATT